MGKPDFCPYDGKTIQYKNLAYELVYPEGWSWQRVKKETVISSKPRIYIMEKTDGRVILLANKRKEGESGLEHLVEFLTTGDDFEENSSGSSYEHRLKGMYSVKLKNPYIHQQGQETKDFQSDYPKHLHMVWQDNIPVFLDESDDPVMYALPCCPYCHRRLPIGWETADDFIGLSLRGPSGSGKTTLLYTLAHDHAAVFGEPFSLNGKRLYISPAYYPDYEMETEAALFEKRTADMCRENGLLPPSGETSPLFLQAVLEKNSLKKRLIIGIYDTPAKMLAQMQPDLNGKTISGKLSENLYADLFLFDPRELSGLKVGRSSVSGGARFVKCKVLSPEEQAKEQRYNKGKVIKASELLLARGQTEAIVKSEVPKTMDLYHRLKRFRDARQQDHMRHMHFVGILTKCDLLGKDIVDVRTMLRDTHCLEEEDLNLPETDYGLGVSWHSVSALGCDAFENDHLLGSFAPIRVSEPILTCIENRMRENKWL